MALGSMNCRIMMSSYRMKTSDRTSRQPQTGMGHSPYTHRGGRLLTRRWHRQVRLARSRTTLQAVQTRADVGPNMKAKARQRRRAGAGVCTPQMTHEAGMSSQGPTTTVSCANEDDGPVPSTSAAAGSRRNGGRHTDAATTGMQWE